MNPAAVLHAHFVDHLSTRGEHYGHRAIATIVGAHPNTYRRYIKGDRETPLSVLHTYCAMWAASGRPAVDLVVSRQGVRCVRLSGVPVSVRRWLKQ